MPFLSGCITQRQRPELLPSNPLAKALAYVFERQSQLKVFQSNPDVPIDTNHLERSLRVIHMGRKNYLFCWSELGAEQLGILQSLMVTCRIQGINPYTYLVDVLQRDGIHPAKDVLDLVPRVWKTKFADNPLKSDLSIPATS
jgi:transposase